MSNTLAAKKADQPSAQDIKQAVDNRQRRWYNRYLHFVHPLDGPKEIELEEDAKGLSEILWLDEKDRAPEFLELFYDLVIVAVLSVFSSAHEVSSPTSIVVYFSYFIIIWWVWASQMLYDVHFQTNDWLHRLFKCAQLAAFAFVGATSANFNPYSVVPSSVNSQQALTQNSAASSFRGVALAYAIGRLLLIAQYVLLAIRLSRKPHQEELQRARKEDDAKPIENRELVRMKQIRWAVLPSAVYFVSAIFWFVAASITSPASARLGLAYSGLVMEMVCAFALHLLPKSPQHPIKPPGSMMSERFSALTLIILGEGIIGIVRSFSYVISGFGFTNDSYGQCFCALVIIFSSWHFLFSGLDLGRLWKRKSCTLWLMLHLPLHFIILLVFAGMRNAGIYGNINDALSTVESNVDAILAGLLTAYAEGGASPLTPTLQAMNESLTTELWKVDLDWPSELVYLNDSINDEAFPHDPVIAVMIYMAQIFKGVTDSFDIELGEDVVELYDDVVSLNDTWRFGEDKQQAEAEAADWDIYAAFVQAWSTELAQGVLFFLPAAGGLLVLADLLVLLRTRPLDGWIWAYWSLQMLFGIGLCFLGFLDMGNPTYQTDQLAVNQLTNILVYRVLDSRWILPTVAIAYVALLPFEWLAVLLARAAEKRRSDNDRSGGEGQLSTGREENDEKKEEEMV